MSLIYRSYDRLTDDWEEAFPRDKRIRLASNNYWSSSEYSSNNGWNVNFNNGNVNNNNKNNNNRVRFVRDMEILSMTIWLNLSGSQMLIWVNCIMDIVLAGSGNATPYRNRNFHSI